MEYGQHQMQQIGSQFAKNKALQNNFQIKQDNLIDFPQTCDTTEDQNIQYDQFKPYSNQSASIIQTSIRQEGNAHNYLNDHNWDQFSEFSAQKSTSQTQITSLSSSSDTQSQKYSLLTQNQKEKDFDAIDSKERQNTEAQFFIQKYDQNINTENLQNFVQQQLQSYGQILQSSQNSIENDIQKKEEEGDKTNKNETDLAEVSNQNAQDNLKLACFRVVSFNYENMLGESLYCDIPFSLNSFLQEDVGNKQHKRLCSYNYFKKVTDIKTFRNGTMIDCALASFSDCSFNHNYLISMLESKGSQRLHELAQSVKNYYEKIAKVIADAQNIKLNYSPEFLQRRMQAGMEEKQRILLNKDPRQNFYFKTYQVNWENFGSPRVAYYGFSKGFCEVVGLSIQEKKQQILRCGLLEYFLYHEKIRTLFKTCLTMPWNLPKDPIIFKGKQPFFTFDNIALNNAPFSVEFHNLSYDFDQKNNFKSPLSEFMIVFHLNLDKAQEQKIKQQRQNRDRRLPDDKNDDEADFYYSKDSQSFLEKYYKDIYGERANSKKPLRRCEYVDIFF